MEGGLLLEVENDFFGSPDGSSMWIHTAWISIADSTFMKGAGGTGGLFQNHFLINGDVLDWVV